MILNSMQGDSLGSVVSGVPGLGSSVQNHHNNSSLLRLWEVCGEECGEVPRCGEKHRCGDKHSVRQRLGKFFSFRRKTKPENSKYSDVKLPKVSVKRSSSVVASLHRNKVSQGQSSNSNGWQQDNKGKEEKLLCNSSSDLVHARKTSAISDTSHHDPVQIIYDDLPDGRVHNGHFSSLQHQNYAEKWKVSLKSKATQTEKDILENVCDDKDYDYVYR